MSRMPGKAVTEYTDLSDSEGLHIKSRLMQILGDIRRHGWYANSGIPDKVIYDRSTRAGFMKSLGNSIKCDLSKPEK